MKKFKALFLGLAVILSTIFVGSCFGSAKTSSKNASAAPVNSTVFTYTSLSQYGQTLNLDNFITHENTTYVVANGSLTINLKPFDYPYREITENNTHFYKLIDTVVLEKDPETNLFPTSFEFEGRTIYVSYNNSGNIENFSRLADMSRPLPIERTELINIDSKNSNEGKITITITKSYTWLEESAGTEFTFQASPSAYQQPTTYTFNFMRPAVNFNGASNPVLNFETKNGDVKDSDSLLAKEQEFESVELKFLSNNYSEVNPLYFNVNYNGFKYDFKIFCKTIESEELLFVNYIDAAKPENNAELASTLNANGSAKDKVFKTSNNFNMIFNRTGRYEIELYDSTYTQELAKPNYYSTSFYVKSESTSPFENIYMIAQSYNANGTPREYIVSDSTQNYTVGLTVKNLSDVFKSEELKNSIEIEISKTIYGASENKPVSTFYSASQIRSMLNANNDLSFTFEDDADYNIIIHEIDSATNTDKIIDEYFVTLAKTAKTHYNANGNNHTATSPYRTEIINYTYNINSKLTLTWNFGNSTPERTETLSKNYINHFSITYGMQQVEIRSSKIAATKETPATFVLDFYGIGNISVEVTTGGETTKYSLNSEAGNGRLTFTDYGKYSVSMTDSMGTTTSGVFEFKQPTNASTIVLIVLSSVIVAIIVIFVLCVRGKVKTR